MTAKQFLDLVNEDFIQACSTKALAVACLEGDVVARYALADYLREFWTGDGLAEMASAIESGHW